MKLDYKPLKVYVGASTNQNHIWDALTLNINDGSFVRDKYSISQHDYDKKMLHVEGLLTQSRAFYKQSLKGDPLVYPLDLFYSFNNLVRLCSLLFNKDLVYKDLAKTHGLSFINDNDYTDSNSKSFPNYNKYIVKFFPGTFSEYLSLDEEIKKELINGCYIKLSDVISRLSGAELEKDCIIDCWQYISLPHDNLYGIGVITDPMTHKEFITLYRKKFSWFKFDIPEHLNTNDDNDHDLHSVTINKEILKLGRRNPFGSVSFVKRTPLYKTKEVKQVFTEVNFGFIPLAYILAFVASSIVRYHSLSWFRITHNIQKRESLEFKFILKDLLISFPLAILNEFTEELYII